MPKRQKKEGMGEFMPTDEQQKAYIWGVNNNLRIAPKATSTGLHPSKWYVEIHSNGKWVHNNEKYGPIEVWEKVYEYYEFYHNKETL